MILPWDVARLALLDKRIICTQIKTQLQLQPESDNDDIYSGCCQSKLIRLATISKRLPIGIDSTNHLTAVHFFAGNPFDPCIHADVSWHKPTTPTPLLFKYNPRGTGTPSWHWSPSRVLLPLLRNTQRNVIDRVGPHSTPNLNKLHGQCRKNEDYPQAFGMSSLTFSTAYVGLMCKRPSM